MAIACGCIAGLALCLSPGLDTLDRQGAALDPDLVTTVTFAEPVECGEFVTGAPYVLGPATVVAITPAPGSGRNGWDVNPTGGAHPYDDRIPGFEAALSPGLPYVALPGDSIVLTTSLAAPLPGEQAVIYDAQVLTVLSEHPAEPSYRPPYFGSNKPLHARSSLELGRLQRLPMTEHHDPGLHEWRTGGVLLDHRSGWTSRLMHPAAHWADYGADLASHIGSAMIWIHSDATDAAKGPTVDNLVQLGIDLHAIHAGGVYQPAQGGHGTGRKGPTVLAALLLGDEGMQQTIRDSTGVLIGPGPCGLRRWSEDGHVHDRDGLVLFGAEDTSSGACEQWASRYWINFETGAGAKDVADPLGEIDARGYVFCCVAQPMKAHAVAMHLLEGGRDLWGDPHFFEFVHRWVRRGRHSAPDSLSRWDDHGEAVDGGYRRSAYADEAFDLYVAQTLPTAPWVRVLAAAGIIFGGLLAFHPHKSGGRWT